MPPSPSPAVSGVWRTAQRTIRNRPTIGIFRKTISHRKVQVSTALDDTPCNQSASRLPSTGIPAPGQTPGYDSREAAPPWRLSAAEGEGLAAELGHRVKGLDAGGDLVALEAFDPLGAELLDVEGGEDRPLGHRLAQQLAADGLAGVGGDVADEATGEDVARPGRVDDVLQGIGGQREEALAGDQGGAVLALLGDDHAGTAPWALGGAPGEDLLSCRDQVRLA